MSLFDRIFPSHKPPQQPNIPFGRYADAYKSKSQTDIFNRSLEQFESGERLEAYRSFLTYLKDERTGDNIEWHEETEGEQTTLHFSFWQGSRRITGTANADKVKAESRIAIADDLQVGFLRRLMEANYSLKFCRFALAPNDALAIKFDSHGLDGSPLKILAALRELAIHADKQDDLLLDEFKSLLRPAEERTYGDIDEAEKEVKYAYIRQQIEQVSAEFEKEKPDPNQYPGAYAYLLLALAFRFDYLIKPEGFTMDVMERIHTIYFAKNDKAPQAKITSIRKEFAKLLDRSKEDFFKEMYRTRSTFGVNPAVGHQHIVQLIEGELPKMDWPLQQNYAALALAVPQYIAGFAMFHYAPPQPDRDLLHLFFQITEPQFFRDLGFHIPFVEANGRLNKVEILHEIKQIRSRHRAEYTRFKPDVGGLDFGSEALFAKSYLLMIRELNLSRER